jgi:D-threo-aldose 1-dehydrogenase
MMPAVTRLGLGLAPLGGLYEAVGDEQAYATVERAWDLGIRYFDTAPFYGSGLSERRAGHVLAGKPRAEYTLSTKVGRRLVAAPPGTVDVWAEAAPLRPEWDFSAAGTVASLEESLDRLGLDRVDILHIHDPDEHFREAMEGTRPALVKLREEGRIDAVSAGMNQAEMLTDFVRTGDFDCVLLAGRYTLLDQSGLAALLPLCERQRVSVLIGGAFNSGILADPHPGATFDYRPAPPATLAKALAISDVCERHGVPLRAAALQFPLAHPAVASVVVGARSPAEVEDAAAMVSLAIPADLWQELRAEKLIEEDAPTP